MIMACSSKLRDLKCEDETLAVQDIINGDTLPIVVRTTSVASEEVQTDIPEDTDILFQSVSEEKCAHIKVLQFYDNKKVQQEKGGEYVLEHDTFVGNEYLMPLSFHGKVKFVRRPGSRGRYLTIKQVLADSPALVKVENETKAFLSSDMEQTVMIQAKTVLELKRIYSTEKGVFLECADGDRKCTFHENDEVNFTVFEKETLYTLTELSDTSFLPQVVLFQEIHAEDAVLKDHTLRSAMLTMVEGPIEVLGFKVVEYLIGWIRNKNHKTYETILVPKNIWNKMYIQKLCFYDDEEKQKCIKRKYGQCLISDFVSKSLYLLPLDQCEVTWLRSPDLFKRNSTGNKLYDVVQITFEDSSDDNEEEEVSLYAEIDRTAPAYSKGVVHFLIKYGLYSKIEEETQLMKNVPNILKNRQAGHLNQSSVSMLTFK
ncbi:uncharacterized protein LOC128555635 isoform X1 [Mercenaria mercenaria]|uniref:uncharacterized protein LOC128555635 isoform X1 n=1 Tax=Mercenaria mercenaria TaxID=6596 RepID=UPI00234E998C|nr:uncharacterized protein LOC128555635 isoform X1 [Mercenaria mercenaria]